MVGGGESENKDDNAMQLASLLHCTDVIEQTFL